jgi:hypothetical protein
MDSSGSSLAIKVGHKFKGSMPAILEEVLKMGLLYNKLNARQFPGGLRCVAFAFDGSRLIGFGENKPKTHTFTKKLYHDKLLMTIHAEADLLMKLLKSDSVEDVTDIVVIRGTKQPLNSHPCSICTGLFKMHFNKVRLWWYDSDIKKWKVELI